MHQRTIATLDRLEKADWFSCVGMDESKLARVLSSWQEAIDHCTLVEWKDVRLEAANQYRLHLLERAKDRFRKWNEIAVEVRSVTEPFVLRKIEAVARKENLPKEFEHAVGWDIAHLCMESEYADVHAPGFYTGMAYWYTVGHFPCGWEGGFPGGHPIIY